MALRATQVGFVLPVDFPGAPFEGVAVNGFSHTPFGD